MFKNLINFVLLQNIKNDYSFELYIFMTIHLKDSRLWYEKNFFFSLNALLNSCEIKFISYLQHETSKIKINDIFILKLKKVAILWKKNIQLSM